MRVVRSLLGFCFILATAATVALVLALYLAVTGRNLPMLRAVAGLVGRAMAGQRTEALALEMRLRPADRALGGTARLTVRAVGAERQRLYFLLNDGLTLRAVWEESADGARTPLRALRLGPLAVVELAAALATDATIRIGVAYDGSPRTGGLTPSGAVLEADDVVLTPADFWYPSDVQGFFLADVDIDLPAKLTLAHNGRQVSRTETGTSARVRWSTERPVGGLALVAGRYQAHARERDGMRFQVLLPEGSELDPNRLLDGLANSESVLRGHYGPSGFASTTLYVNRRLVRAFNDGTGLLGMPPRYFTDGDYGFAAIAHEVAHNWWGATVAERWLQPGSGGEWIVEGFAEFSSWRAVRAQLGEAAQLRMQAEHFFDPDQTASLESMSVLDNGIDPNARPTIYNKGGYVTFMLAQLLGDEAFDAAAQRFLTEFRQRQATATDVETVFAAASGQDLAPFFAAWVRGNESLDLALEPQEGGAAVRNLRTALAPAALGLWRFPPGSEPEKQSTALGAVTPIGNAERVVLDPLALAADMFRSNNVLPRRDSPRAVARSLRGELLVVSGEPYAWEPATVEIVTPTGQAVRSWVLDRGLMGVPAWSADGTRVLAVESARGAPPTLLALHASDGSRQSLGHDTPATGAADATIVVRGTQLLRVAGKTTTVLADHPNGRLLAPAAAPSGGAVAYAVAFGPDMELRVLREGAAESEVLFTWPAGPLRWRWSPDGARLFAVLTGDWDWQLWELPLEDRAPRALVREAAGIADLAVSPDGQKIALVAQAELNDPLHRHEIFIVDRAAAGARHFTISGRTASSTAWLDDESLLVVVADPTYPSLPVARELRRLKLSDGALENWGATGLGG